LQEGGELMAEEFFIPQLGQTVEEVTLIKWLVEDGAKVEQGQEILEVETDKAVFPVESFASGYLHIGPYKEGDVVPVLEVVAIIGDAGDKFEVKGAPPAAEGAEVEEPAAPDLVGLPETPAQLALEEGRIFASPRARMLAREKGITLSRLTPTGGGGVRVAERDVLSYLRSLPKATPVAHKMATEAGLDLRELSGTGPGGKVTREDVERALKPMEAPAPPIPPPVPLPEVEVLERNPLKGVRGIIAERMAASAHTTARVTLLMDADATQFVDMRERLKARVSEEWGFAPGYNDLLAKIVAIALRKFPYMNARLTADAVEVLAPVNMGMAVDTERGLLVPVIRDADQKSLRQFGIEFRELAEGARTGRISPDALSGGTFTITNLGMYDVDAFTPVINLPEAAILGLGRITERAVVRDGQVVARHMWTLSLVFDHRLVDGAPAARFLQYIKDLIEEPYLWVAEGQGG
jgi:pyruvate dehydrogenase E2 component (dihydrolipoamide acetyltransferase)